MPNLFSDLLIILTFFLCPLKSTISLFASSFASTIRLEIFNESKINLIITTYIQDLMEHPENNIFSEETHNNIDDALEKLFNLL